MFNYEFLTGKGPEDVAGAVAYFNDLTATPWGWFLDANGRIVGDFNADDTVEVGRYIREHFGFNVYGE